MFRYLPEQASEIAPNVDWIHNLITDLSVFFTVAIVGAMIYFAIKYRRRGGVDHETPQIRGSHALEIVWTTVPTIICVIVAYYGIVYYHEMRVIPKDAMTINVWGQKWQWDFTYENGKKVVGKFPEFVVPVDKPIKLVMQSRDVLHSFFIPAMRVKKDVVPGQYTYLVFKPVKAGTYPVFCTEYCGKDHSNMMASLRVVARDEYDTWVKDRSEEEALAKLTPAEKGKSLFVAKGCNACHSLDGTRIVGPSFLKIFGHEVKLSDGKTVMVDENYIKSSILDPNAQVVESFAPNQMPSFSGQLGDDEIDGLIAFIKSVDGTQEIKIAPKKATTKVDMTKLSPAERGKLYYDELAVPACKTCHTLDGNRLVGPSFKGVFGREEKITGGTTIKVDEAYIKESLKDPSAKIVDSYPPSMPKYEGALSDEAMNDIIEFLKTVK